MLESTLIEEQQTLAGGTADEPRSVEQQLPTVCIVGLGYVGLPVAVEFGKQRPTVGYDLSTKKVRSLQRHDDVTGEYRLAADLSGAIPVSVAAGLKDRSESGEILVSSTVRDLVAGPWQITVGAAAPLTVDIPPSPVAALPAR